VDFPAGQLHAVLGPAGAGQQHLLHLLAGTVADITSGTININGTPADEAVLCSTSVSVTTRPGHISELLTVR
jgi:ABC-type multidrug transport system ATPase subunit